MDQVMILGKHTRLGSLLSAAVINTTTKATWGREALFHFTVCVVHYEGRPSQVLRSGMKRTVEEHCSLLCCRPFRDLAGLELEIVQPLPAQFWD